MAIGSNSGTDLSVSIDALWARFLPEMRNRVCALEQAAAAYAGHSLSTAQHREAHAAAHKLAGTLGTFGLGRGTELALEVEGLYGRDKAPDAAHGERLTFLAAELRRMIESRMQSSAQATDSASRR